MFKGICLFRRILANAPRKGARRVVPLEFQAASCCQAVVKLLSSSVRLALFAIQLSYPVVRKGQKTFMVLVLFKE
jgi:hypothetical protein